ncbi:MAG: 4Fe-4S binding protein [Spirochaetales bacterium]|nr:4Fe-4S binding protein [Spirochaetales bacterium]
MLTIDFLGQRLKNPLMLTEGPLSGNETLIREASEADIGLIFTKGIRIKPILSPVPYMSIHNGSLMNADWSCIGIEEWIRIISRLDSSVLLVASIAKNYVDPGTAVEMAERLVKAGARIISFVDYDPDQLVATVKMARPRIKVPLMVKLPPFLPRLEDNLKSLVASGVDAIAAMDSIGPGLFINTADATPSLGSQDGSGYLSGAYILPFTLKYIYEISGFVDIPVVGVGGVSDTDSAIQMMMAGATGVGMVTSPLLNGLNIYKAISGGLRAFLQEGNYDRISDICGLTRKAAGERKISEEYKASIADNLCINCGACREICYSRAIRAEEEYHVVNWHLCTGCGLCKGVCPENAVEYC